MGIKYTVACAECGALNDRPDLDENFYCWACGNDSYKEVEIPRGWTE